jgi:hypothetical protein
MNLAALAVAMGALVLFLVLRRAPAEFPPELIAAGVAAYIAFTAIGTWIAYRLIDHAEQKVAQQRLAQLVQRARSGESLEFEISNGIPAILICGVAWISIGIAAAASRQLPVALVFLGFTALMAYVTVERWPVRGHSRLSLDATALTLPRYGRIPWQDIRAVALRIWTGRGGPVTTLRCYVPSLSERVRERDWSTRLLHRLRRNPVARLTADIRLGMTPSQAGILESLCQRVAAAAGQEVMTYIPASIGDDALLRQTAAFVGEVERRGAQMSAQEIDAHVRKLQDIEARSKLERR